MFAYCGNNPVHRKDTCGKLWQDDDDEDSCVISNKQYSITVSVSIKSARGDSQDVSVSISNEGSMYQPIIYVTTNEKQYRFDMKVVLPNSEKAGVSYHFYNYSNYLEVFLSCKYNYKASIYVEDDEIGEMKISFSVDKRITSRNFFKRGEQRLRYYQGLIGSPSGMNGGVVQSHVNGVEFMIH